MVVDIIFCSTSAIKMKHAGWYICWRTMACMDACARGPSCSILFGLMFPSHHWRCEARGGLNVKKGWVSRFQKVTIFSLACVPQIFRQHLSLSIALPLLLPKTLVYAHNLVERINKHACESQTSCETGYLGSQRMFKDWLWSLAPRALYRIIIAFWWSSVWDGQIWQHLKLERFECCWESLRRTPQQTDPHHFDRFPFADSCITAKTSPKPPSKNRFSGMSIRQQLQSDQDCGSSWRWNDRMHSSRRECIQERGKAKAKDVTFQATCNLVLFKKRG